MQQSEKIGYTLKLVTFVTFSLEWCRCNAKWIYAYNIDVVKWSISKDFYKATLAWNLASSSYHNGTLPRVSHNKSQSTYIVYHTPTGIWNLCVSGLMFTVFWPPAVVPPSTLTVSQSSSMRARLIALLRGYLVRTTLLGLSACFLRL